MKYNKFLEDLETKYFILFKKGLKKQANKNLEEYITYFKYNVSKQNQDEILYHFCKDIFDNKKTDENLSFHLKNLVTNYLEEKANKNKMPQMVWLLKSNNSYDDCKLIQKICNHKDFDDKTANYIIYLYLSNLWWCGHHLPDNINITKEEYENIIKICENIISNKKVCNNYIKELNYYQILYNNWFLYKQNNYYISFKDFLKNKNINNLEEILNFLYG